MGFAINVAISVLALVGLGVALTWLWRMLFPRDPRPLPPSILVLLKDQEQHTEGLVRTLGIYAERLELDTVVIDDHSQDGTGNIIERVGKSHIRVVRVRNGNLPTVDLGLAMCRSPLVVLADMRGRVDTGTLLTGLVALLDEGPKREEYVADSGITNRISCFVKTSLRHRKGARENGSGQNPS